MNAKFNASAPATLTTNYANCCALAPEGIEGKRRAARKTVNFGGHVSKSAASPESGTLKLVATVSALRPRGAAAPRQSRSLRAIGRKATCAACL